MTTPRLVLTAGEPAGIGPDLVLQIANQKRDYQLIVIADPALLEARKQQLGLTVKLEPVDLTKPATVTPKGTLHYMAEPLATSSQAGRLDRRNANYVLNTLLRAHQGCEVGHFDALVTAPIHKGIINDADISFTGHTEFFADQAGVEQVVMMLAIPQLKVALATTHLPLKAVSSAITQPLLTKTLTITEQALRSQFGIAHPRIAVCGLNPHAGEGGHLGDEEIQVIIPVIEKLKQQGLLLSGPWPADTIFLQSRLSEFDAVFAMYHDQGLPVLKHAGFSNAVNITLGLPYIRTSVDHGTALALAGTGKADTGSLLAALKMAQSMVLSRNRI